MNEPLTNGDMALLQRLHAPHGAWVSVARQDAAALARLRSLALAETAGDDFPGHTGDWLCKARATRLGVVAVDGWTGKNAIVPLSIGRFTLTARQTDIYNALAEYITDRGMAPTVDELCSITGLASKGAMYRHLEALERRGWIERLPNSARAINLIPVYATVPVGAAAE